MFHTIAPNNLDRLLWLRSYFEDSLSGYNRCAKILRDWPPPGRSSACAEQVGAEAGSPSVHLITYRQKDTEMHVSAVPVLKIYMGKGKSTGRLVQLHWEAIKLKDNCGRIAHKFQSVALKQTSWGINFITQLQCALWFNKWKTFCFTTYFKDSDHSCCTEVWDVSLTFTARSCMEALFLFSLLAFFFKLY